MECLGECGGRRNQDQNVFYDIFFKTKTDRQTMFENHVCFYLHLFYSNYSPLLLMSVRILTPPDVKSPCSVDSPW